MPDLYGMMTNVRLRLGDPRAQSPNDAQLLNQVCSQIRIIKRHRRGTGYAWDFNDLLVDVNPNENTYQIVATDFGQPLAVMTWDPTNPIWIPRLIRIFEPQNIYLDIPSLPNKYASYAYFPYDGSNATAQRVAFYWRDNVPYIEFWPLPQLAATYKVRYLQNTGNVEAAALTDTLLQTEDSDLAEIRSALALLAISEWYEPAGKDGRMANAEKRKDLFVTLQANEAEARRQFEVAVRQPTGPRIYNRFDPTTG